MIRIRRWSASISFCINKKPRKGGGQSQTRTRAGSLAFFNLVASGPKIDPGNVTLRQRLWVVNRPQPWNPPPDRATVRFIVRAEHAAQRRLLIAHDEQRNDRK